MTVHDQLFQTFAERIKHVLYEEIGESLYVMGISHSFPKDAELNFAVIMVTSYLLKIHGISRDSDFPDISSCEEEFDAFFASAEKLSTKLRETGLFLRVSGKSAGDA